MPVHDIIDNRQEKLVDHINRILDSSDAARFAVGYFFRMTGEHLMRALTELYHQHSMRDWSERLNRKAENQIVPKIICGEGMAYKFMLDILHDLRKKGRADLKTRLIFKRNDKPVEKRPDHNQLRTLQGMPSLRLRL
jgi:hypothetical protein